MNDINSLADELIMIARSKDFDAHKLEADVSLNLIEKITNKYCIYSNKDVFQLKLNFDLKHSSFHKPGGDELLKLISIEKPIVFFTDKKREAVVIPNINILYDLLVEMYNFEYYITNSNAEYLIHWNDHEFLIGFGDAEPVIRQLAAQAGVPFQSN